MEGVANRIECPLLVIAAGLDRLCPTADAQRLARETKGKTELLLVEDGNPRGSQPLLYRGRSADWMARQLAVCGL